MLVLENKYTIQNYSENMTDEEFLHFCMVNKDMRIERDKNKNIIIMAPVNNTSGYYENEAAGEVRAWAKKHKTGVSFSPSTGFTLPNRAVRSPDACWVSPERWATLTDTDKTKFAPVCPDFVIEIRSKTDNLKPLIEKMEEWMENGVRLGWLIDPQQQQTYIYRENAEVEIIKGFDKVLSGEQVMPDFEFELGLLVMP